LLDYSQVGVPAGTGYLSLTCCYPDPTTPNRFYKLFPANTPEWNPRPFLCGRLGEKKSF
jgi:hypothetical protein